MHFSEKRVSGEVDSDEDNEEEPLHQPRQRLVAASKLPKAGGPSERPRRTQTGPDPFLLVGRRDVKLERTAAGRRNGSSGDSLHLVERGAEFVHDVFEHARLDLGLRLLEVGVPWSWSWCVMCQVAPLLTIQRRPLTVLRRG